MTKLPDNSPNALNFLLAKTLRNNSQNAPIFVMAKKLSTTYILKYYWHWKYQKLYIIISYYLRYLRDLSSCNFSTETIKSPADSVISPSCACTQVKKKRINTRMQSVACSFEKKVQMNCIGCVMVSVLTTRAVDRGFEPRSDQTKDYKIDICCFSAKHAQ